MPYPAHKWLFCVQNTGLQQRIYEYKKKKFQKSLAKLKKTSKIERRHVIPAKAAKYREEMNKMITE